MLWHNCIIFSSNLCFTKATAHPYILDPSQTVIYWIHCRNAVVVVAHNSTCHHAKLPTKVPTKLLLESIYMCLKNFVLVCLQLFHLCQIMHNLKSSYQQNILLTAHVQTILHIQLEGTFIHYLCTKFNIRNTKN